MADFVNFSNTKHRPDDGYSKVIDAIQKDGVCPFCPENLEKYHKNPILKNGVYWVSTNNMYPYEGAKYHALIIHKTHVESLLDLQQEEWSELQLLTNEFVKEKNISGGTFFIRFGKTSHTGASVSHLHANIVSPDAENPNRKPIVTRVG